jgi:hypothetical protein
MQRAAAGSQQVQRRQAPALLCLAPVEQGQLRQRVCAELLQRAPDAVDVERDGLQGSNPCWHASQLVAARITCCAIGNSNVQLRLMRIQEQRSHVTVGVHTAVAAAQLGPHL